MGYDALPALDMLYQTQIHAIVLTHAHLDHIGSPAFVVHNYLAPGGQIYMTDPTAELIPLMSMESVKQLERNRIPPENRYHYHLYFDRRNVQGLRRYFSPRQPDHAFEIAPGITGRFFSAGHILGSAGICLEDGQYSLVYTGDIAKISMETLSGCKIPEKIRADCLMIESTHGASELPHTDDFEAEYDRLAHAIGATLKGSGHAMIPCFALGRSQELIRLVARMKAGKRIPEDTPVLIHRGSAEQVNRIYDRFLPSPEEEPGSLSAMANPGNRRR